MANYDIEIIMRDDAGIGYGYIYETDLGVYSGQVYQNRLNNKLITNNASYERITNEITQGKAYCIDEKTKLEAINEILDFYFMGPLEKEPEIKEEESIQTAVSNLEDKKFHIFYIERTIRETKDETNS